MTLTYVSTQAQRSVTTGPDGTFFFLQLSTGAYMVSVEAGGFALTAKDVEYAGVPIHLDFRLAADVFQTEVMVRAGVLDPAAPAHVDVSQEQIERFRARA